jgi:hypothetical protein
MIVALIALFVALGGSAAALSGSDTVQSDDLGPGAQVKAPDVADNAVNGADVVNGSLGLADLNAGSRPHKLEFSVPASGAGATPIATVGNLRVSGQCSVGGPEGSTTHLFIALKNVTTQQATMNALLTRQQASDGGVDLYTVGQFVGAGAEIALDRQDSVAGFPLVAGNFGRAEGQVVFQTPGRVTTIDFHAFTAGPGSPRCEFYGTGVTSNLS